MYVSHLFVAPWVSVELCSTAIMGLASKQSKRGNYPDPYLTDEPTQDVQDRGLEQAERGPGVVEIAGSFGRRLDLVAGLGMRSRRKDQSWQDLATGSFTDRGESQSPPDEDRPDEKAVEGCRYQSGKKRSSTRHSFVCWRVGRRGEVCWRTE